MDIRAWGVPPVLAVILAYWVILLLVTRWRGGRRLHRALRRQASGAGGSAEAADADEKIQVSVFPSAEGTTVRIESEENLLVMLLWALGPPLALILIRYLRLG